MPDLFQVDAFSDRPFSGNPAAVCFLDNPADPKWMQQVAAEMNLAETAFVCASDNHWQLRWFTPAVEVDLCGHATLATAHILWETGKVATDAECIFKTKSGELRASKAGDSIQLNFPAAPVVEQDPPDGMIAALGVEVSFVGLSPFDYLVEVESTEVLRKMKPDMKGLMNLGSRGVIVTCRDDSGDFDFISRFFGPAVGIDEDPVTGSAHCTLGPYWMERLGKSCLNAWQASARGGGMQVEIDRDRVKLLGKAVTVLRGELCC